MALILRMTVHQHSITARRLHPKHTRLSSSIQISPWKSTLLEISARSSEYNSRLLGLSDTLRSLAPLNSEELEDQRRIVLSRDTSLILKLNFTPTPGHPLAFDALVIPRTRSVKHDLDRNNPHLLSLKILVVDALTSTLVQVDGWDQEEKDEKSVSPSLVDFQADQNIIHLRDGNAMVRFTLPCCLLDSSHRTGLYR